MDEGDSRFDICVVCAMPEEASAFLKQLELYSSSSIKSAFSQNKYEYRHTTMQNGDGEELTVMVSWLPRYGPLETGLHLHTLLTEFQPRFAAMVGICAGDKQQVALGDLVVAERTFFYDTGKFILDADGNRVHLSDVLTAQPANETLQFIRMFTGWIPEIEKLHRPASKRQQREWLLNELFMNSASRVDDIPIQMLQKYAPMWRKIVRELQTEPDAFLTPGRELRSRDMVGELRFSLDVFPFVDPPMPTVHVAPMGSGSAVRADNPFNEIRVPVRGTAAIDMEGASFYHTLVEFPAVHSLLVKCVCDYADNDKDDSYHEYAATASALYMLSLIRSYVTSERVKRVKRVSEGQDHGRSTPLSEQPPASKSRVNNSIGSIGSGNVRIIQGENVTIHHSNGSSMGRTRER